MIPLRLTVKNFMCYREDVPVLDLEGIHVACLCGDNGHGKTALLDAVTWALWGQARARTQDELVHQGQRDMAVELEFSARGQRYRVDRRFARSGRSQGGSTILELQVSSGNGFRAITGNSIRETEAKVRDLLHMDYDTFTNTAFLLQGRADLFTSSTPSKRKEVLAEVLDLSYYARLEERARERARSKQSDMDQLDGAIGALRREVDRTPEHEESLASVEAILARLTPETQEQRLKLQTLRSEVDTLRGRRDELVELTVRLAEDERDVEDLEGQAKRHRGEIAAHEATLSRETEITGQYELLELSRAELDGLNQALAKKSVLDKERAGLEKEIAVQTERLSAAVTGLRGRISQELEPRAKRLPEIEAQLVETTKEQARLTELDRAIALERERVESIAAAVRDLALANERLHREMEETRSKFDMLEQGDTACPLCSQPLGPNGKEHLRLEYEAHGRASKSDFKKNEQEKAVLERQHSTASARLTETESELKQGLARVGRSVANLERDRADSANAGQEMTAAVADLEAAQTRLDKGEFAGEERSRLAGLDLELSCLAYDAGRHAELGEQVKALDPFEEMYRGLAAARRALPVEREALEKVEERLGRRRKAVQATRERRGPLERELGTLPALELELNTVERRHKGLDGRLQSAEIERGVLKKEIERCREKALEIRGHERERRRLADDKAIYDELTFHFGKNGIQADIIHDALPQLEVDANELLSRLTDGRMTVKLQIQQGRMQKGAPSEELQIKIADELGTRSYETFSGGEAFRVNFAIRVALSKLLARRSGAPLPILFIDEGFGSQDADGQERLKEVIQSIQGEFEKIIVITHLDQIKESFPTRIEVTKTPSGSTFVVL